jgi:small subunit ribosomal protein S4
MKLGPKYKIAKRLGANVFEKTQTQKFAIASERHAKAARGRGRGATEYGKQLLEKQKVRFSYGIAEQQFRKYVARASSTKNGTPHEALYRILELRLDNVAYRLGLAPTRQAARQLVSHGHLLVNGRRTTIPSREMHPGDRIKVREGSRASALFAGFEERFMDRPCPAWLSWNPKTMEGGIGELPGTGTPDIAGDLGAVLSFYSR